jgi:hypothetical protein
MRSAGMYWIWILDLDFLVSEIIVPRDSMSKEDVVVPGIFSHSEFEFTIIF